MQAESVGKKQPEPLEILIGDWEVEHLKRVAVNRNAFRKYEASKDRWKCGLTEDPIFKGLIGECAVCNYLRRHRLNVKWDYELQEMGDAGVDLTVNGMLIQVKTGVPWIRRFSTDGRMLPLESDFYVFSEKSKERANTVKLNGWVLREHLTKLGIKRPQGHFNIEVSPCEFEPMNRLVTLLRAYG